MPTQAVSPSMTSVCASPPTESQTPRRPSCDEDLHSSSTSYAERARELERVYKARRGHATQISISDDSHHVTEAIGDMYGDNDFTSRRDSRPLSFIQSPTHETFESSYFETPRSPPSRHPLTRSMSNEPVSPPATASHSPNMLSPVSSDKGSQSPPRLNRQSSGPASQTFEFQDIDYQSSPAAVAQELSNLQAIRRMSMDVNNSDPDLPSFSGNVPMPAAAPSHSADDDDPSRLFWVPARVHPELAPKEFKTFIEEKVEKHRRRSSAGSEESFLSPGGLDRQSSGAGLRRKKSMLSKQVDGPNGYRDGADRLERHRSQSSQKGSSLAIPNLEDLVEDPATLIQQVGLRDSVDSGVAIPTEDIPILPVKPSGQSLKRSTRTNYRRGSLRKGERVPFSRRMAGRQGPEEAMSDDSPGSSPVLSAPPEPHWGLTRTQTEPTPPKPELPGDYRGPNRVRSPSPSKDPSSNSIHSEDRPATSPESERTGSSRPARPFHSRIASNGRTTAPLPGYNPNPNPNQVPQIVETPPQPEQPPQAPPPKHPERKSSKNAHEHPPLFTSQSTPPRGPPPASSRAAPSRPTLLNPKTTNKTQTLDDMASHPTAIPGHTSATSTDSLSIIPTFTAEERKPEPKYEGKKSRKGHESEGGRKSSWGWFSRGDDKEEEKEKERKGGEDSKKLKSKLTKPVDKSHDNTRLDVLQTSIDGGKGRESLVLDRDSIKLEEERKKESTRKSSKEEKKDKDGLFSSLFGGSKKKGDRDSGGKKAAPQRGLSPEPPPRVLKPDIDYNWTRFSILEERAIYRMAHIKLANPRRELHSQVLLSNFMYSYLAKVQQMHPHIQIGQGAQQKQQQRQAQQQQKHEQQQQPEEFQQYQRYQEHSQQSQQSQNSQHHNAYGNRSNGNGYSVASGQSYMGVQGGQSQPYHQYEDDDSDEPPENDMW
ncbi:hypothetical protein K490DRAFT_70486 [Saccharata proteae CBS 121410]|uniref:Protein Zds1 C-terminal domain-containing protein n=1 Tax=Saccharata proteae CBS 121410 TaxID=1314787 RepID=A0A9P4M3B8_9PEZI|nr:hypothetical protein K490DRAFT_70486 [Saccharata proteae CBS 121410]